MADMSEAKHSPGPWTIGSGGLSVMAGGIRISQSGYVGAACVQSQQADLERRKANAKLIASAPEMLAILIEQQEAGLCWDEWNLPLTMGERINEAVRKATT